MPVACRFGEEGGALGVPAVGGLKNPTHTDAIETVSKVGLPPSVL